MAKTLLALVVFLSTQAPSPAGVPFQPWGPGSYQTVNAIEFSPDGQSMFVALFPAQVAKAENRAAPADAPEVALYESRREGDRWSAPRLLPFAGRWKDYEASLSPDGQWMLFNSWRPMPDGRTSTKNNLWLTRRTPQGWSSPVYLSGINRPDSEESYAAIGPDGLVVFLGEGATDQHGIDYNLYQTRITGDRASAPIPFAPAATAAGESDPWMARDGSYLIFTRWDRAQEWGPGVDLHITFRDGDRWTAPIALSEINDPAGPDYAVSIAGSPERIYWKRRGGAFVADWAPLLAQARARANSAAVQPATDWLTPFVGAWETIDTYNPVKGAPIVERARRTCEMVMQGSYLQCETVANRPAGGGRTYRFLINYNRTMKRFEMLSLWSNVPHKSVQAMTPNDARDRWSLRELAVVGDDEPLSPHYSEVVFEHPGRIVWTGRRVTGGVDPASAPVSFVEIWSKLP
jgi:hypothetical protein